ncbi:MAG: glycoside hydrolase family 92 protein [Bacteroidales bacterium]|nr:glycoside hydrolase family 92 protein [Bacteroidales bacterium]
MKHPVISILAVCAAIVSCGPKAPADYVNVFVGTGYHGHTFPGAATPYGLVQLSPDTRVYGWDGCSGYYDTDSTIIGFSHTHLSGTGSTDMGDFMFVPQNKPDFEPGALAFSHKDEKAYPGYYSVNLRQDGIKVELTATAHVGVHRYKGAKFLLIDFNHTIGEGTVDGIFWNKEADNTITGGHVTHGWSPNREMYFAAKFSTPYKSIEERDGKLLLCFDNDDITAAVGLSCNSVEAAKANLAAESPELNFDKTLSQAKQIWADELGRIKVKGGTTKQLKNFYSALYHCMLPPNLTSDAGQPKRYSTFSLWDTFRTWNPLMTLINPQLVSDMVCSMIEFYDRTGELPIWSLGYGETNCMIGYHSVSVIADAYLAGIGGFDANHALDAMVASSNCNGDWSEMYNKYGYVPADLCGQNVSRTLEFCYDDWCIARMAESLGRSEIADEYYKRAQRYRDLFDGTTSFFRGKFTDGNWSFPFDNIASRRDYTEAIPWQYRFFVPHDVKALECLLGGKERMIEALDSLFTYDERSPEVHISDMTGLMGQYAHGNEPSHNFAYLYLYTKEGHKTQHYVRTLLETMYDPTPEGLSGNEDCGQMSAWYVMSAIGLYPFCPGNGEFLLTSPVFKEVEIGDLKIKTDKPAEKYIQSVKLNGKPVTSVALTREQLHGELEFSLGPNPTNALEPGAYSYTKQDFVSTPGTDADLSLFNRRVLVKMTCQTPGAKIICSVNGRSFEYKEPFYIEESCIFEAYAEKDGMLRSGTFRAMANKATRLPAKSAAGLKPGVKYQYKEGPFLKTAEVVAAPLLDSGVMPAPSIEGAPAEDHFGYIFEGMIQVPEEGIWSFGLFCDDGSVLFIDGKKVVDCDGSHAANRTVGRIALDKGVHSFRLLYFDDYEDQSLVWEWKSPTDQKYSVVPADKLYHL